MIWSIYNEKLVRRGEIFVEQYIFGDWSKELSVMNDEKVGRPFDYADTFMALLAYIRYLFSLPYRQTEGFARALSFHTRRKVPDYSIINRRVNALKVSIMMARRRRKDKKVTIAVDSTGIKVTNRGDWLRKKWNKEKKKGYLKIHFAIDPKTKEVISMDVTKENVHDGKKLKKLVKRASKNIAIGKVIADGAYDSKDNFQFLSNNNIEPAIKVRKNSSLHAGGCYSRKVSAINQLKDFKSWKDSVGYGSRWIVESAFSFIKRTFGEYVRAKKYSNMVKEMLIKTNLYNMLLAI
jgi:hypothetical protein